MPYSPMLVKPMREELTSAGVEELLTPADVDRWMGQREGTALLVVNSVCGCAAGMARPGVRAAAAGRRAPDRVATVFAGQDLEATARCARVLRRHPAVSQPVDGAVQGRRAGLVRAAPPHRGTRRARTWPPTCARPSQRCVRAGAGRRPVVAPRVGRPTWAPSTTTRRAPRHHRGGRHRRRPRCSSAAATRSTRRGVVLLDVDVHSAEAGDGGDAGDQKASKAAWRRAAPRASASGGRHRHLVVPRESVASIRRLGDVAAE